MTDKFDFKRVFKIFKKHYRQIPLVSVSKTPFQTLVAVMLSARTRDETTAKVCKKLFKIAPTARKLDHLGELEIRKLIYPVGFYKTKAKHLKRLSEKLIKDFSGRVPKIREELMTLPGIGRKSANLVLVRAFKIPAIAVDTHVHRISNLLGWVKTKTPEQTEKALTKILPKKYWLEVNNLLVSIGQQYRSKKKLEEFLRKERIL